MAEETFLQWYICSVMCDKVQEDGTEKKVKERYLVQAVSVSDAEATLSKEVAGFVAAPCIDEHPVSELFGNDSESWYKASVDFITVDEKSGKDRHTKRTMYVNASSFEDAVSTLNEGMKGTVADWELVALAKSAVLEVFK